MRQFVQPLQAVLDVSVSRQLHSSSGQPIVRKGDILIYRALTHREDCRHLSNPSHIFNDHVPRLT